MTVHPDLEALTNLRIQLEHAENNGDPEPIIDVLTEDAVLMVPTYPVSEGKAACAAFLRELLPGLLEVFDRRITYASREIEVEGSLALDRGVFSFVIRPRSGGEAGREQGKYLFVSRKDPRGVWRLARAIVTLDERDERRALLRHYLAALAYRTEKALRDAPSDFGSFTTPMGTRPPTEIVRHMTAVLGAARAAFIGKREPVEPLATLADELARFRQVVAKLSADLASDRALSEDMSIEILTQGPFADAMTHAGQLAMLRRIVGAAIPAENFMHAAIRPDPIEAE